MGKSRRKYEVALDKGNHITLEYANNGKRERMTFDGDDAFIGYINAQRGRKGLPGALYEGRVA